jgi:Flp pilus assembly protein TadG
MILCKLRRDEQGAAAIEMAFTLPILVLFLYGIFQVGVVMAADAGMQHALGEGARLATLYPTPTDDAIKTKISDKKFGVYIGTFNDPTVTDPGTAACSKCRDLSVSYMVTPNFLFFNGPTITLNRTKRVYLSF